MSGRSSRIPSDALRLLVDIAIRALSPAVNDPTTAVQSLDQIEDLLIRLGNSQLNIGRFADATGRVRLMVPFPTWDDFLRLALDEIRMYGRNSTQIMRRMSALLAALTDAVLPDRLPAVRRWEERLDGSIAQSFNDRGGTPRSFSGRSPGPGDRPPGLTRRARFTTASASRRPAPGRVRRARGVPHRASGPVTAPAGRDPGRPG